jgi:integrase
MKITQNLIERGIDTEGKADFIVWDDTLPGFGLRIRKGGSQNFVVQYKLGTKQRRVKVGPVSKLTYAQARKEAKKLLGKVALGQDPQGDKLAVRAAAPDTFKSIAERFLKHQATTLRASSYYSTKLYLLTHAKRLHQLNVAAVTRREVASVLSTIAEKSGTVSAGRARSALSAMFAWAVCEGIADTNPVIGTTTYATPARDRVLTNQEIAAIWSAVDGDYGTIVKLLFYTGARRDEIGDLTWSEVDLEQNLIRLPAERCKNHRAFDLPLAAPAVELLREKQSERRYVFGKIAGPYSSYPISKAELDAKLNFGTPWQLRDIRRTVATGMAEVGVLPHVIEAVLNHVSGHKAGVAGIYNRATYAKEKREALEIWSNHIAVILAQASGANVTSFPVRTI